MPEAVTEPSTSRRTPPAPARMAGRVPEELNVGQAERVLSIIAGGALALNGLRQRGVGGLAEALLGAVLLERGATGQCRIYSGLGISTADEDGSAASLPQRRAFRVRKSFTVQRSPDELYAQWRRLEELPSFLKHLESVTVLSDTRSRWVAPGPMETKVEWEAEITDDVPGERIAWRSVEGSKVANRGEICFRALPAGRGTVVDAEIEYAPPAGALGEGVATLFRDNAEVQVRDDLRRFKNVMETGEFPTIHGQTSCYRDEGGEG